MNREKSWPFGAGSQFVRAAGSLGASACTWIVTDAPDWL
jgi:hypothetical protein